MSLLTDYEDFTSGDWQRDYLFKVMLSPPSNPLVQASYAALVAGSDSGFDRFVISTSAVGSKTKIIKKEWAGQWANYAGPLENNGLVEVVLQVDEDGLLLKFLESWKTICGSDLTAAAFPKRDLTGALYTTLYRTDKETPVLTTYLSGVWLPDTGDLALNKGGEGLLQVKVNFAYDGRDVVFH